MKKILLFYLFIPNNLKFSFQKTQYLQKIKKNIRDILNLKKKYYKYSALP